MNRRPAIFIPARLIPWCLPLLLLLLVLVNPIGSIELADHIGDVFDVPFTDLLSGREYGTAGPADAHLGTLVVFWSSHCGTCLAEIPDLNALYAEWRPRGVEIIGFPQDERPERLIDICRRFGITWPQNLETGRAFEKPTAAAWNVVRTPSYLLLDGHGLVLEAGFTDPESEMAAHFR